MMMTVPVVNRRDSYSRSGNDPIPCARSMLAAGVRVRCSHSHGEQPHGTGSLWARPDADASLEHRKDAPFLAQGVGGALVEERSDQVRGTGVEI